MTRRDHGTGSAFQRTSDWRWIGTVEAGWTAAGTRKRKAVTGKGCEGGCAPRCAHRTAFNKKLRDLRNAAEQGNLTATERTTVKQWVDIYADMRLADLSPKGWNAAINPLRKWVVPTIGHRRLDQLTPGDVRAVADAQRKAGRQPADTHRTLKTMLKKAAEEGHAVPASVLAMKAPRVGKSDRQALTVDEGLRMLKAAAELPHGSRWLFTLLYGQRMGECLGLTWEAVDFTPRDGAPYGEAIIEWQLQPLPYRVPRDRRSGFRVPDGYEARHLVDAYHLVRPKSRAGYRVAPLLKVVRDPLVAWRERSPVSPHDLVWPADDGRPKSDKADRAEWHHLQTVAEVAHPSGRPYHVHECRNFAATMLLEADVPEHVVTELLGHSTVATSLRYRTRRRGPLLEAMQKVGDRLQLG